MLNINVGLLADDHHDVGTALHRDWYVHFACVNCYIFAKCSQTPASTLNLSTSSESQWNVDSNNLLSIRKYYQLFMYKSNTFLCEQYVILPIQTNGGANAEKSPKQPLLLEARGPISNTSMPGVTPLTIPNDSSIIHTLPHNYATMSPLVTMGRPKFTPKLPLPLQRSPPI